MTRPPCGSRWIREKNLKPFDDLRDGSLLAQGVRVDGLDLRDKGNVLRTVSFDTRTRWPNPAKLPPDFDPAQVLTDGKDPGLGVGRLYAAGITGKGVAVAIIGEPIRGTHREFSGRIARCAAPGEAKTATGVVGEPGALVRGTAVAGILAGTSVGVAPESRLYYWVDGSAGLDYQPKIDALNEIRAFNEARPKREQIRVVGVSAAFHQEMAHLNEWKAALKSAADAGIIVIHGG